MGNVDCIECKHRLAYNGTLVRDCIQNGVLKRIGY